MSMSRENESNAPQASLAEVKSAAEDLLTKIARADLTETDLFPHGITQVSVTVKAGSLEVSVAMSGPDHAHAHADEEWTGDEMDDLFDEDEEE
jgi:hypothetical protein